VKKTPHHTAPHRIEKPHRKKQKNRKRKDRKRSTHCTFFGRSENTRLKRPKPVWSVSIAVPDQINEEEENEGQT
jgi:hypothetical protein